MALKTYTPVTPAIRHLIAIDRSELYKGAPVKTLTEGLKSSGGRNNHGHITSRHRGGGHKRAFRVIDFKRNKMDMPATVDRLEYDPNRTAFIALITYEDGEQVKLARACANRTRSCSHCLFFFYFNHRYPTFACLNSGELRLVRGECLASIGAVSNADQQNTTLAKAGRARWLGIRPQTRGIAMNPVDHPHGGRTNGGQAPATPWGKCTRGKKTRTNKKTNHLIMRSRHVNKKQ